MDMAVPMVIMIKAPSKLGVILLQSTPTWASSSKEGPWQAERKLSKAPEDTTLWPFRSARCRALRSARGQLGFIST